MNSDIKGMRKSKPFSISANACSIFIVNTTTSMVNIKNNNAGQVKRPNRTNIEQISQLKMVSNKEGASPIPSGSANPNYPLLFF
jgi:hypothetical protein